MTSDTGARESGQTKRGCILVGLGNRGRFWHDQLKDRVDVEIAAYVEPAEPNRRMAIDQCGIDQHSIYGCLHDAIEAVRADFVLDVTPPAIHHEIAAGTFEAGLHLLGEKPLSDDFQTARQIVELGRRAGRKHMITHNYRFASPARTLHRALCDGMIGSIGQCDVQFYKAWADLPGSHYVTEPYMLVKDMMVHHFDLMRYFLGLDPVWVQAITWNHSWGWHKGDAAHAITFEFPQGIYATHVTQGCSVGYSPHDYNGAWRFDGAGGSITWADGKLQRVHQHKAKTRIDHAIEATQPPGDIVTEFLAAVDEDREPECSAADHIKSLAMVFAVIKSAKEQRRVAISEL